MWQSLIGMGAGMMGPSADEQRRRQMLEQTHAQAGATPPVDDGYARAYQQYAQGIGAATQRGPRQPDGSMSLPRQASAVAQAATQRQNPYGDPAQYGADRDFMHESMQQGMGDLTRGQSEGAMAQAQANASRGRQQREAAIGMGAAIGGQYLNDRAQDRQIRRDSIGDIYAQRAAAGGAPTYGIQAAEALRRTRENEGLNYLQPLLQFYQGGGFGGGRR